MTKTFTEDGITIDNICVTCSGVKYAMEEDEGFEIEYLAHCIEHGEEFYSSFYAPLTYNKQQLRDIGYDLAIGWGGECISVSKVISNNADGSTTMVRVA